MNSFGLTNLSWKTISGLLGLMALAAYCIHKGQADTAFGLISAIVSIFGLRWGIKGVADKVDNINENVSVLHAKVEADRRAIQAVDATAGDVVREVADVGEKVDATHRAVSELRDEAIGPGPDGG